MKMMVLPSSAGHEQEGGLGGQSSGDTDSLLHSAGQLGRQRVGPLAEAHTLEHLAGSLVPLSAGDTLNLEAEGCVLEHRAVREEREVLEHHGDVVLSHAADLGGVGRREVGAVDHDAAGGGLEQTVEGPDEGGLARAGEAHDDEDLALLDVEGGVDDCRGDSSAEFRSRRSGAQSLRGFLGLAPEDLGEALHRHSCVVHAFSLR